MNQRYRFWDELFEGLIRLHLYNGNYFDTLQHYVGEQSNLKLERLDQNNSKNSDFLRYTFTTEKEEEIVYLVKASKLDGFSVGFVSLKRGDESIHLDVGYPTNDEIKTNQATLESCYAVAVAAIKDIWSS